MRLRIRVPMGLWAAVAFSGCAALGGWSLAKPASGRYDFFPLHPGTLWVYEVRDAQGRVALERVLVRGSYRLKTQEIDGTVVEESGGMSGEFDLDVSWYPVVYYRRGPFLYKFSGVQFVDDELRETPLGEGEEKVLPDDPAEQPRWESDFDIFRSDPHTAYRARTISIAGPSLETVRVPAGVFRQCLKVESQSMLDSRTALAPDRQIDFRYTDWYASGVGLVKSEARSGGARLITSFELLSFRDGQRRD